MRYCATRHPGQRLHLSVQGSATNHEAIDFYVREFNVSRVVLPRVLAVAQIEAVKVEGRQRSPAYVAQVTRVLRAALDACLADPDRFVPEPQWVAALDKVSEGACHTLGAYHRPWQ